MRVETRSGTTFRLTYGTERRRAGRRVRSIPARPGSSRSGANAGADVRRGWHVTDFDTQAGELLARDPDGRTTIRASVVVGRRSAFGRGAGGRSRPARLDPRSA
jgi:hypothetical protein